MRRLSGKSDRSLSLVCGLLFAMLAFLAALQYRWLGTLSEAERSRLRAGAHERADGFAREFDREITRVFAWLQVRPDELHARAWSRYAERLEEWSRVADEPEIVERIYVAERAGRRNWRLSAYDGRQRAFRPCEWPGDLDAIRRRLAVINDREPAPDSPRPRFNIVISDPPTIIVPILDFSGDRRYRRGYRARSPSLGAVTVIRLDLEAIRNRLLPELAERYFAENGEPTYGLRVVDRSDPRKVLYQTSARERASRHEADAEAKLFAVRPEDLVAEDRVLFKHFGVPFLINAPRPRDSRDDRPPMDERPMDAHDEGRSFEGPSEESHVPRALRFFVRGRLAEGGAWRLYATHRSGSIDVVVASSRRRNLAVSFGIMLILATSVVLIVLSAQRARKLAQREVEFVASVTHELRTPLSVILSASENLADGVVREAARTESYGELIRSEAKRLGEMVERTLAYAGANAESRRAFRRRLHVADLVDDALVASSEIVRRDDARIEVSGLKELPLVEGDPDALVRALHNLIENGLKHGGAGRWLRIVGSRVKRHGRTGVRISVEDRGAGIPKDEQRTIFEPFRRGREALENQVRGSGLGLAIVKRIAEAHDGRVEVRSEPGRGSVFTLVLPAAGKVATEGNAPGDADQ
jgi:two-component system sensor histidine kinase SenX3